MESRRRAYPATSTSLAALLLPVLLAGCTPRHPLPPLDATHPASPEAAEAPVPVPSTTLEHQSAEPGSGTRSRAPRRRGAETVYACPMHPDVRQATPGRCPKCGMALQEGGHGH